GPGEHRADRVVVGDDQLDPQLAGQLRLADCGDPAIHRDDQRGGALQGQSPQRLAVDPVALLDAVRDVIGDVPGAGQLQAGPQQARTADAVDVIIAVNDDPTAAPDRAHDP